MAKKQMTFQQALMASFNPVGNGPVGQRASHEAMLRYLPQIQALLMLRQQTGLQGRQNIQSVRRGGLAAAGGIGGVRQSFTQQLADTQAPTSEAAAHLGLTRDAVAGDLAKMQAQQYSGISAGVAQARRSTQTDQANIVQQLLSAAQQGSLYNTSEYDSLANDAHRAKVAQRQAQNTLTAGLLKAGYDATGQPIPGIFNRLHPPKTPTVNKYGRTPQQWAALSDGQRRQIVKSYSTSSSSGRQRAADLKPLHTIDQISGLLPILTSAKVHLNPDGSAATQNSDGSWPKGTRTRPLTPAELAVAVQKKIPSADPTLIHAANQRAHGGIDRDMLRRLKQLYPGLKIPKAWVLKPRPSGSGLGGIAGGNGLG